MVEKISLRVFWAAMFTCAVAVLSIVWITFEQEPFPLQIKTVVTSFVVGLAAFLVWIPLIAYRFLDT